MSAVIVRYRVKAGRADENAALVRAVYDELATERPPRFRYATFVLEDGLTFVHVAFTEDGETPPLSGLPAFQRFRSDLAERCDESPQTMALTERIGGYGM